MTVYTMTTIDPGTRIRKDHTTFAAELARVPNAKTLVTGSELWVAPADGNEVKAGDKWVRVTYNNVTGWMAVVHKGVPICDHFGELTVNPPPPAPIYVIPDSFVLVAPDGTRTEFKKAV